MKQEPLFDRPYAERSDYYDALVERLSFLPGSGWPDRMGQGMAEWSADQAKLSALSLFSGGGGLDIGFHQAGFEIHSMVEIDPRFVRSLDANSGQPTDPLGEARAQCIDIGDFSGDGLPQIDFIIGGPPCQTFSAAGRRAHGVSGINDPRGVLFEEYVRLLRKLEPQGFLFENVYGIVGAQGGGPWRLIVEGFEEAGYELSYRILDSADYGVPQHRERLFIVGRRDGRFRFPRPTHGPDSSGRPHFTAGEAIADLVGEPTDGPAGVAGRYGHLLEQVPPGLNYSFFTERMGHPQPVFAWRSKFSDFLYKADPDAPVRTIKASGGQYTGPFHWDNRPFSTRELMRLQTFPDDYQLVGNRSTRIEQIGNSVPPQIARILALSVRKQLFDAAVPAPIDVLDEDEALTFRSRKRLRTKQYEEKAREAISLLHNSDSKDDPVWTRRFRADLESGFALCEREDGAMHITVEADGEWVVSVDLDGTSAETFEVELRPVGGGWHLSADRILLRGRLNAEAFTASWKALERTLGELDLKADLVQLNGYYQYEPRISSKMTYEHHDPAWHIVASVVAGHGVRAPHSSETLAFTWGVEVDTVHGHCQFLRRLGYEVRNSNTNPQIPEGQWLIPYAFPTLNPRSVQLAKNLDLAEQDDE